MPGRRGGWGESAASSNAAQPDYGADRHDLSANRHHHAGDPPLASPAWAGAPSRPPDAALASSRPERVGRPRRAPSVHPPLTPATYTTLVGRPRWGQLPASAWAICSLWGRDRNTRPAGSAAVSVLPGRTGLFNDRCAARAQDHRLAGQTRTTSPAALTPQTATTSLHAPARPSPPVNDTRNSAGLTPSTRTTLSLEVCPRTMLTDRIGTPARRATKRHSAAFAAPSTGGASRTSTRPLRSPAISSRRARGMTRTSRSAIPSA